MRFIAYGCSYTQGAELADDWLTGKHHITIDKEKQKVGVEKFYQHYTDEKAIPRLGENWKEKYHRVMRDRSYAAQISKVIQPKEYVNRATSGNSNKSLFLDVAKDMQDGFIKQDDIVYVGLTSADRYTWFQHGRMHHGLPMGGSWPNKKARNAILGTWIDDDYCYETILAVRALEGLLKNYKFFYQTVHYPFTQIYKREGMTDAVWKELIEVDRNSIVPGYSFWTEIDAGNYENPTHGFHHPRLEIATKFGNRIGTALRAKLGLDK